MTVRKYPSLSLLISAIMIVVGFYQALTLSNEWLRGIEMVIAIIGLVIFSRATAIQIEHRLEEILWHKKNEESFRL